MIYIYFFLCYVDIRTGFNANMMFYESDMKVIWWGYEQKAATKTKERIQTVLLRSEVNIAVSKRSASDAVTADTSRGHEGNGAEERVEIRFSHFRLEVSHIQGGDKVWGGHGSDFLFIYRFLLLGGD